MMGRIIDNKGIIAIGGEEQPIYQKGGWSCGYDDLSTKKHVQLANHRIQPRYLMSFAGVMFVYR